MCGISLIINPPKKGKETILRMMEAIAHRGPDNAGFCGLSDQVFLSANRLKILDLSDVSNQPIWSSDRKSVLVWNGALYNYRDLRKELLDLGYTFEGKADSEVLLYWLKEFGHQRLSALKGMFAIIFADVNTNRLLVLRDPSGEKPLYFSQKDNTWVFSSETKAVLAGLDDQPEVDKKQFLPFFYSRHSFPDKSFYKGIDQVLPGKGMILDFNGNRIEELVWNYPVTKAPKVKQETLEGILENAVLKNCHAERPVGMILSGGADSSLLYAMWYEKTGIPLHTFTVAFDQSLQKKYSDPVFVNKLIKRYPSHHQEVPVTLAIVMDHWDEYIQALDQPVGDSASFLTWWTAKQARVKVQVLISGAGADELFGGYNRHLAFQKYLENPAFYLLLKKYIPGGIFPRSWQKMLEAVSESPERTFMNFAALLPIPEEHLKEFSPWYPKSGFPLIDALEWDRSYYLVNDILKIHDNACMAHGIEGRAPYLDYDLILFSLQLSETQRREQLGKKWIKTALNNRNLGIIAKRKKLGFGLPLQEWVDRDPLFRKWVFGSIREMGQQWGKSFPPEMRKFAIQPEQIHQKQFLLVWNLFLLASWLKNKIK